MHFRTKMLSFYIILGLAIITGLVAISVITQNEILQMEEKECQIGAERVQNYLRSQLVASTNASVAVTLWDEYYQAIRNNDLPWLQKNILSMTKANTPIEFIVTLDQTGKVLAKGNTPDSLRNWSVTSLPLYQYLSEECHFESDFVKLNEGFYIITLVKAVKTGDKEFKAPFGYTLYGRKIDPELLNEAKNFTGFGIELVGSKDDSLMSNDFKIYRTIPNDSKFNLVRKQTGLIITYHDRLKDKSGKPLGDLYIQMSSMKGTTAINSFLKGLSFVGLFIILTFIICLIAINHTRKLEREVRIKKAQEEQMQQYQAILEHKIAERTENLQQANWELEQKNRELVDLQAQIIQQEKLASIGLLAAGVAHEINNPMGFIAGNFNALKKYLNTISEFFNSLKKDGMANNTELAASWEQGKLDFILDDIPGLIRESEDGIERVIHIVKSLKDFSRINQAEKQEYDLNQGIESTLVIARNSYKYVAEIEKDLQPLPMIKANGGEINEVILNILVNAAQAIEEMKSAERKLIKIKTYVANDNVYCEIEDNGPGMPEQVRNHIFDPFFTTKEPGKGTGLGLSISYNIITHKHHGNIEVESEVGKGTKFRIQLPIEKSPEII